MECPYYEMFNSVRWIKLEQLKQLVKLLRKTPRFEGLKWENPFNTCFNANLLVFLFLSSSCEPTCFQMFELVNHRTKEFINLALVT